MGIRVAFLPECPLILSLLKYRGAGAFLNQKMRNPNRGSPLNSSIDIDIVDITIFCQKKKEKEKRKE